MCKKNGRFFYTLFYSLTFCFILILIKKIPPFKSGIFGVYKNTELN